MSQDHKNNTEKDIDPVSGIETTGHEWDGLKELNNPLPRWWLWVFALTVLWSLGYFVVYPSWPTPSGNTPGIGGYTQFKELETSQAEIKSRQASYLERFDKASLEEIMKDPELYAFANAGGEIAFKNNCAVCHGSGGQGSKGYPNLNDDDWLWGGKLGDIYHTLKYGIRSGHDETRFSQMPAFGKDQLLKAEDINKVVDYVLTLSGSGKPKATHAQGMEIFKANCAVCHGDDGKGNQEVGAPNLADKIWLYGGDRATVYKTVYNSRYGIMPAWETRLDDSTLRQLTVYLHQLGGGQLEEAAAQQDQPEAAPIAEPAPAAEEPVSAPATETPAKETKAQPVQDTQPQPAEAGQEAN